MAGVVYSRPWNYRKARVNNSRHNFTTRYFYPGAYFNGRNMGNHFNRFYQKLPSRNTGADEQLHLLN